MRIPLATYRLQFHAGFPFSAAEEILDYLRELGVSDVYASPVFRARAGSMHGYDVLDPLEISPELGGREAFERLLAAARDRGLGWVQDIVPNHMAVDSGNRWLMDVLEHGEKSRYRGFFDVDWNHPYEDMRGVLLLPFLGKTFAESLEAGELVLRYGEEGFSINYYGFSFPLAVESYLAVAAAVAERARAELGREHPDVVKLLGVLYILRTLPESESQTERYDQAAFVKRALWELCQGSPAVGAALDETIDLFNGKPGDPASFDRLERLLARQHFKLSHWKTATQEINYRRFFTINDLISLRVQYPDVFAHTHGLISEMVAAGKFTGLRVDHIDGLFDPAAYLKQLRAIAPEAWIVVEKILEEGEELPGFWPVAGTSGYDFLGAMTAVCCRAADRDGGQGSGQDAMTRIWSDFTGLRQDFEEIVREKKRQVVERDMAGDVEDLAHHVKTLASRDRRGSDVTLIGLRKAMTELLAELPVYRTYFSRDAFRPADLDYLRQAAERALARDPDLAYELGFLRRFLALDFREGLPEEDRAAWTFFALRFQQISGPIMAKGLEDCALYLYNRLVALNEVGASPGSFGMPLADFHAFLAGRAARWPHALNGSTTHDTKRAEDARARLVVLSEAPALWERTLGELSRIAEPFKETVRGRPVPDRNEEWLLYQSILGALPATSGDGEAGWRREDAEDLRERIKAFAVKALREAKVHTGWIKPDEAYEAAALRFIDKLWDSGENRPFFAALEPLRARLAFFGCLNSLAWTLVKIAAPGVPDFYQGTELFDLSLVDPDNRRPVDFARRARLLREIKDEAGRDLPGLAARLLADWPDGRVKLFATWRALQARAERAGLFQDGGYLPLAVQGERAGNVLAFARTPGGAAPEASEEGGAGPMAVVVAPLFPSDLGEEGRFPLGAGVWGDAVVELPEERGLAGAVERTFVDVLTGRVVRAGTRLRVADVLEAFPVALLIG